MTTTADPGSESAAVRAARSAVAAHRDEPGPLLAVLQEVQAEVGHVPSDALEVVAEGLNVSRADVHGVLTFYRDLRREPAGRVEVRVCRAEACQAVGADALLEDVARRLGVPGAGTTPDGGLSLDHVFCLGNCALGPSALVAGRVYGRMDGARLEALARQAVAAVPGDRR
jgi:formate dehydrogenase subunit gamma